MTQEQTFMIRLTTDPSIIKICAQMMSGSDPWITLEMNYHKCLQSFEGDGKEIYVAESENEITGFVIIQLCGTFKGYIQTLCVGEAYRNRGLGKKLLQFCEERISMVSPNIFICVSTFNKRAIKLYYELGFKLVGELENFVKEGFNELLLRKTSGPLIDHLIDRSVS